MRVVRADLAARGGGLVLFGWDLSSGRVGGGGRVCACLWFEALGKNSPPRGEQRLRSFGKLNRNTRTYKIHTGRRAKGINGANGVS